MNDFTVLMQIERQMQKEFHGTDQREAAADKRGRLYDGIRLWLSGSLYRLANAVEPRQQVPHPASHQHMAR